MYVKNGIAYAGEQATPVLISGVRPLADHKLWLRFNTGEIRIFDFNSLLDTAAFQPLKQDNIWNGVYIDYGVTVWQDGDIDIAPEYLYKHSMPL